MQVGPYTAGPEVIVDGGGGEWIVAAQAHGRLFTAWESGGVKVQCFSLAGVPVRPVVTADPGRIRTGSVIELPKTTLLVWSSGLRNAFSKANYVYAQQFSPGCVPLGGRFTLNTGRVSSQAIELSDGFVVVYLTHSTYQLRLRRYNDDLSPIGNETIVTTHAVFSQPLLISRRFGFTLIWDRVYQSFDHQGVARDAQPLPLTNKPVERAVRWGNRTALVWLEAQTSLNAQVYDDAFLPVSPVQTISTFTSQPSEGLFDAVIAQDELIVVWRLGGEVHSQRLDFRGELTGPPFTVNNDANVQNVFHPVIASYARGFLVGWTQIKGVNSIRFRLFSLPMSSTTSSSTAQTTTMTTLSSHASTVSTATHLVSFSSIGDRVTASSRTVAPISPLIATMVSTTASVFVDPVPIVMGMIAALALSLCASLGLYLHHRRKHTTEQTDSSHQYVNLRVSKPSHYRDPPVPRQSSPADYDSFGVVEAENAYRNFGQGGD